MQIAKKASSLSIAILLTLSALVFLVPLATVHAAGPTITLSATSGTGALADGFFSPSGDYGGNFASPTSITVTGTGFPSGQTNIQIGMVATTSTLSVTSLQTNALCLKTASIKYASAGSCTYPGSTTNGFSAVTADANGNFMVKFAVPEVQAQTYNIAAIYTPTNGAATMTSPVVFTVNTGVAVANEWAGAQNGVYGTFVHVLVTGFKANEQISVIPTNLLTNTKAESGSAFTSFSVGADGATDGEVAATCKEGTAIAYTGTQLCDAAFVSARPGGAITAVVFGGSSGLTASTTFTLSPSIAIEPGAGTTPANGAQTAFVLTPDAGSGWLAGRNFAASTVINAGSLTLGGVATVVGSVTTDSSGSFAAQKFTYVSNLPLGSISATFNGTSFTFANGNIIAPYALYTTEVSNFDQIQGAIIVSKSTSPAYFTTDSSSYQSYYGIPFIFGVGFSTSTVTATWQTYQTINSVVTAIGTPTALTLYDMGTPASDGGYIGYFFIPKGFGSNNQLTLGGGGSGAPALAVTVTSLVKTPSSTSTVRPSQTLYPTGQIASLTTSKGQILEVYGMTEDTTFSVTIGGVSWATISISSWATAHPANTACNPACNAPTGYASPNNVTEPGYFAFYMPTVPDVPAGPQTITVTGTTSGNTVSASRTVGIVVGSGAMSLSSGTPGGVISLVTSSAAANPGIHGLAASTLYTVTFGGATVGTFTSTPSGDVPAATQFTVPALSSGTQLVDILASTGTSAVYAKVSSSTSDQYKNLEFTLASSGIATPSAGGVGATVTLAAAGLSPSTAYTVQLVGGVSYTSFTSTATGAIPAGTSFKFPSVCSSNGPVADPAYTPALSGAATSCTTTGSNYGELGTTYQVYFVSPSETTTNADSTATYLLQASLGLNATSEPAGHAFIATGSGLYPSSSYNVVWNAGITAQGLTSGQVIGAFTTNSQGSGAATVTVPASAASGSYSVSLMRATDTLGISGKFFVIVSPPSISVGAVSGSLGTNTLTASGTPAKSTTGPTPAITASFTNTLSSSLSVYMWVSVTNSAGQSVGVLAGGATIGAGQTVSIPAPINLPTGTYTGTVFCTTSTGVVISTTSSSFTFSV